MRTLIIAITLLTITTPALADDYPVDVVADAIRAWADDHECGWYCTDARRDGAPDRSDDVVTSEEADELAQLFVDAAVETGIPVAIYMAVSWHESNWQTYAVGAGGECGIFQQTRRYMRPEEIREELGESEAICDWLQVPANAVLAFSTVALRRMGQFDGDDWLCGYHQGHAGCNPDGAEYREDVLRTARRAERNLETLLERRDEGGDS